MSSREGAFSVKIIGIEPEVEAPVSLINENIADGRWLKSDDEDSILIGQGLADAMGAQLGDEIGERLIKQEDFGIPLQFTNYR